MPTPIAPCRLCGITGHWTRACPELEAAKTYLRSGTPTKKKEAEANLVLGTPRNEDHSIALNPRTFKADAERHCETKIKEPRCDNGGNGIAERLNRTIANQSSHHHTAHRERTQPPQRNSVHGLPASAHTECCYERSAVPRMAAQRTPSAAPNETPYQRKCMEEKPISRINCGAKPTYKSRHVTFNETIEIFESRDMTFNAAHYRSAITTDVDVEHIEKKILLSRGAQGDLLGDGVLGENEEERAHVRSATTDDKDGEIVLPAINADTSEILNAAQVRGAPTYRLSNEETIEIFSSRDAAINEAHARSAEKNHERSSAPTG
ncbi:uncharacterized protein EV422DRAFT_563236 [Fimicolochytrium jonesii]|uniref:uncharacterized protein n=1 Tax=Fimicolochytrium jonesii TaxID=1396493 RepID=UPI0022FF2BB8|nr:uncharacterized protein EV422DRAFT_563236 [Fimicolochytrium jonesii]KAI8827156.1 hypothetical protein EV422DRAFT_563236 [Fimicolochytrium jonesii]